MQEYPAYTVEKIESELTYELLYLLIRTAVDRKKRQASEQKQPAAHDVHIDDIADGKATVQGFEVERVVKK